MFSRFLMEIRPFFALLAMFLLPGEVASFAQPADDNQHTATQSIVGNSGLKLHQAELIREFEEASSGEYTLGAGDEIELHVPGQADLQGHHVVGPDGRITLSLVGAIKVAGKTREEAAQDIAKAWGQYYSTINVTVQVTKYGSNRIVVVGHVASPGPLYFDTPPTLLEALAKSGAYNSSSPAASAPTEDAASVSTNRVGAPSAMLSRCAIYRGTEQVLWIDMQDLFSTGAGVDLHLKRDDVVYVPDDRDDLVSVLGQVQHPGAVRLRADASLVDLLAMAGGLNEDANSNKIRLVRPSTGMTIEVSFNDLLDPSRASISEVSVKRGDVIYVPKRGLAKVGYFLDKINPAGTLLMFGAIAGGK